MVAPPDESCSLARAARARPHRLRIISGRRRLSHRRCQHLAISVDCSWNGRITSLCGQPAVNFAAGAAFIASIAYSAYLIQKLVIHFVAQFCFKHDLALTSVPALVLVEICVYAAATLLFLAIERPFLQLRHRLAPRPSSSPLLGRGER